MPGSSSPKALYEQPLRPGFYSELYGKVFSSKTSYFFSLWHLEEEWRALESLAFFPLQDPFKLKSRRRSHFIANFIIDQKGNIKSKELDVVIAHLEKEGYIPLPSATFDKEMICHFLVVLKKLASEPSFKKLLKKFHMPLCHKYAEGLIRHSVGKPSATALTDRDVQVAALSCLLYPLRQNVGSCFATAPAILIQKEQMENLLYDLYELLTKGKMSRTIEGHEHSVPMCPSIGLAELRKPCKELFIREHPDIPISILRPLEMVHVLKEGMSLGERRSWWKEMLKSFLYSEGSYTVESFFEYAILKYHDLSKEEMEQFLLGEKSRAKRALRIEIVETTRAFKKHEIFSRALEAIDSARWQYLAMTEDPLARMWEYTLASFSEVKMDFSRWNLFTSLGLKHTDTAGIGKIIYDYVEKKIQTSNEKLQEYQRDYEVAFDQLRAIEVLLKQASSESEARRLKAEFQSRSYHMQACLELRNNFYKKASFYPHLFSFFLEKLDQTFPGSFQEIYDPQMQEASVKEYEDSPAGFRLVYKHGRRDASLWTMIRSEEEFIDALVEFFIYAEPIVASDAEEKGVADEVKEVFSRIIAFLRTDEFMKGARQRSSMHAEKGEKTPWCYVSGGVMSTLIKTYFLQSKEITLEPFTVEGGLDLVTVIVETLKSIPYNFSVYFPKETNKRMLIHSPTHAFLLEPYREPFFKAWDDGGFTYTWIRDHFVQPYLDFYQEISLSPFEQDFLLNAFLESIETEFGIAPNKKIRFADTASVKDFASFVLSHMPSHVAFEDLLGSFLYQSLPLVSSDRVKDMLYKLIFDKMQQKAHSYLEALEMPSTEYIAASTLREIAKGLLLLDSDRLGSPFDIHEYIALKAEQQKLSPPLPLVFADSNWSQNFLAFVVSPINEKVELWRVPGAFTEGIRMSSWLSLLSKTAKQSWGIYIKPQEYSTLFQQKF